MTDQPNGEAPRKPRIVIEFAGPGMADCSIAPDSDVTPGQLYGAAWLLEAGAREARTRQLMGDASGLVAGTPDLASLLGRLMGPDGSPKPPGGRQ